MIQDICILLFVCFCGLALGFGFGFGYGQRMYEPKEINTLILPENWSTIRVKANTYHKISGMMIYDRAPDLYIHGNAKPDMKNVEGR